VTTPISTHLLRHRESRGISQADAAHELNVVPLTYRHWEHGDTMPGVRYWATVSGWLRLSISDVVAACTEGARLRRERAGKS